MMYIDDYIDYKRLWKDVVEEWKDVTDMRDVIKDQRIVEFVKNNNGLELMIGECTINQQNLVTFCFGEELNTANESNNRNEWFIVIIVYDLKGDMFVSFEIEQG